VVYAVETARAIFRDAERVADEDEQKKIAEWARRSQSLEHLKAMWTLAKADLAVSPEELDTDPMLLNVENGTVDLRTGSLRPHLPEDLITKLAPVEFDPVAEVSRFMKFLKQTLVDAKLIAFVERFLGYSLTDSTKERALSVLHGVGKNGKSTLVELFLDLMGDYAATTKPPTLMQERYGEASKDYHLAELAGVRFLAVSETKRGAELDEATVKQITGGDTISARSPYGKPFTYRPQFTIWLSTNHKPEIPDGSEAIWDRLHLIPFLKRFEGKKADPGLAEKLREELPGVLAWAVRGCVEWVDHALGSAAAVEAATAAYRAETDVLEEFFQDRCYFYPEAIVSISDLYETWERWCDETGEDAGGKRTFAREVRERGVVKNVTDANVDRNTRGFAGISVSPPRQSPDKSPANVRVVKASETGDREKSKLFSEPPRVEKFVENDDFQSPVSGQVSRPPSEDDYLEGSETFEEDGLTIEYIRESE
jgi:putative DNA primase/helicase